LQPADFQQHHACGDTPVGSSVPEEVICRR
jgi:hypothetical protein